MERRIWPASLLFLILLLVMAACGAGGENETGNDSSSGEEPSGEMKPMIEQLSDSTYRYTIINETGETMNFEYTSGQRFDFSLEKDSGEQVFLFSSVSFFTQALGEETVGPGEELNYEFEIPELGLEPGTYKLKAWLTPENGADYPAETEHTVE